MGALVDRSHWGNAELWSTLKLMIDSAIAMEKDFAETLVVIAQRVGSSGEGSTELGLAVAANLCRQALNRPTEFTGSLGPLPPTPFAETTGAPTENQRAGDDVESPASPEEDDYELISWEDECDN